MLLYRNKRNLHIFDKQETIAHTFFDIIINVFYYQLASHVFLVLFTIQVNHRRKSVLDLQMIVWTGAHEEINHKIKCNCINTVTGKNSKQGSQFKSYTLLLHLFFFIVLLLLHSLFIYNLSFPEILIT